jgi:hypothetical protein
VNNLEKLKAGSLMKIIEYGSVEFKLQITSWLRLALNLGALLLSLLNAKTSDGRASAKK